MKIKDKSRKAIVEATQRQIQGAIDHIIATNDKLTASKKDYIQVLEGNILRMPYYLGYLHWEEPKKKKIN
jgi:hypothetical protein